MENLLKKEEIIAMMEDMIALGPRLTGNAAHKEFCQKIMDEMTALGYEIKKDLHTFKRWEPKKWGISYNSEGKKVDVAFEDCAYYPYSGCTPPEGVTAPMKFCWGKPLSMFLGARGKIAVVRMPNLIASPGIVFKKRWTYPEFEYYKKMSNPVVTTFVFAPLLFLAKAAGCKGVICVMEGTADDNARFQYLPFIKTYAGMPTMWVTPSIGKQIIASAKKKELATLTLDAEVFENAETETFYAVLPGKSAKKTILVNTHTDGTNAFEENAPIALLSLAKYFAAKPIEEREHTLIFSFITGHFQLHQFGNPLNQATTRFLNQHPEFWDGKDGNALATAGVALEHLGCTQWTDNEDHTEWIKVSDLDPELVYTSNKKMAEIYTECLKETRTAENCKTLLLRPKNLIHFGEGQPIYKKGIPSISLCPGSDYLCNIAPNGYIDKCNYDMFEKQIETFAVTIEKLDKMERKDLGKKQGFAWGFRF